MRDSPFILSVIVFTREEGRVALYEQEIVKRGDRREL